MVLLIVTSYTDSVLLKPNIPQNLFKLFNFGLLTAIDHSLTALHNSNVIRTINGSLTAHQDSKVIRAINKSFTIGHLAIHVM